MSVDAETLGQLRAIMRRLQTANANGGTSLAEVVELARKVETSAGLTVDFEATPELGQPLVVVRVKPPEVPRDLPALTARERAVALLITDGLSNKEIARQLHLSVGTVKQYVHQILDKWGLSSRVAIATSLNARRA